MVDISEFVQSGDYKGERATRTEIYLVHPNKSAGMFCSDKYSSMTYHRKTTRTYSSVKLNWDGSYGPLAKISITEARAIVGFLGPKLDDSKDEDVTMKPGDTAKDIKVNEGTQGIWPALVWKDEDHLIILTKVLDLSGKDVTPTPEPIKSTPWTDIEEWFRKNWWILAVFMALIVFLVALYYFYLKPDVQAVMHK